jgi:hypothetical protein
MILVNQFAINKVVKEVTLDTFDCALTDADFA